MARVLFLALLVLLGVFGASAVAVDTELPLQAHSHELTPELQAHLSDVHRAVSEAEAQLEAELDEHQLAEFAAGETAFLEAGVELSAFAEADSEADADMAESLGLDADYAEDALFMELEALLEAEAEADAEAEGETEAEVDSESQLDSEAGSVTVPAAQAEAHQSADPIVTEQMETQAAIEALGLLEASAQAQVDAEAEADAESESTLDAEAEAEIDAELDAEMEAEADAEMEAEMEATIAAEAGEEQTAITKCGKKVTWERNEEPNPEAEAQEE